MMIASRFDWNVFIDQRILVIVLLVAFTWPISVNAGEVVNSDVQHDNGRFTVHSSVLVYRSTDDVRRILTDFKNLSHINTSIKNVDMLAPSRNGILRMRVKSEVCALFICLNYKWVQEVTILPSGDIVTRFDPAMSDFREGWVRYRLLADGEHTRLITDAVLVPDFWFPPIIGTMLIKGKLSSEALEAATGIEAVALRKKVNRHGWTALIHDT